MIDEPLILNTKRAICETAKEIDPSVVVVLNPSEWFCRDVMGVVLKKSGRQTEEFKVTTEQAHDDERLRPVLEKQIASLS